MTDDFLNTSQMREYCGFSGSYIPDWSAFGQPAYGVHFPAPKKQGRLNYWLQSDLDEWIAARARKRDPRRKQHRRVVLCAECGQRWPCDGSKPPERPTLKQRLSQVAEEKHPYILEVLTMIADCGFGR